MSEHDQPRICQKCQTPLPPDLEGEVCRACLMLVGIESAHPTAEPAAQPQTSPGEVETESEANIDELRALLPDLELMEVIGQGGMGIVYKARQKHLGRLVALKLLKTKLSGDPTLSERFTREARALAKLSHPNIVGVHDFGQAGDRPFLIMEYIDGTNLREMILHKSLSPKEAIALVSPICEALQYAHEEGVVHRDIKPENILIDKRGRVRIADFGLARIMTRSKEEWTLTGTRQVMGTPNYMAPEQRDRPQEVDHRADIFSLGVVIYEMLTGELPIGRFELPSRKVDVDVRMDEVVLRTLENEPARRYQHASDVQGDISRISSAEHRRFALPQFVMRNSVVPDYAIMGSIVIDCIVVLWNIGSFFFDRPSSEYVLFGLLHLIFAGVMAVALREKRERGSARWSTAATVLSLVPLHLGAVLCLPFALWYLIVRATLAVLSRDATAAFAPTTNPQHGTSPSPASPPDSNESRPDVVDHMLSVALTLVAWVRALPWRKSLLCLMTSALWCAFCIVISVVAYLWYAPDFIPSRLQLHDDSVRNATLVSSPDKYLTIRAEGHESNLRGARATKHTLQFDHIYLGIAPAGEVTQNSRIDSMHITISDGQLAYATAARRGPSQYFVLPFSSEYEFRPILDNSSSIVRWLVRNGIGNDSAPSVANSLFKLLVDLRNGANQVEDSNGQIRLKPISSMIEVAQFQIVETGGLTVSIRAEDWAINVWFCLTLFLALLGIGCIFYFVFKSRKHRTTAE